MKSNGEVFFSLGLYADVVHKASSIYMALRMVQAQGIASMADPSSLRVGNNILNMHHIVINSS